jgi:hypothetical protein
MCALRGSGGKERHDKGEENPIIALYCSQSEGKIKWRIHFFASAGFRDPTVNFEGTMVGTEHFFPGIYS